MRKGILLLHTVIILILITGCGNSIIENNEKVDRDEEAIDNNEYFSIENTKSKKFIMDSLNANAHPVRMVCFVVSEGEGESSSPKTEMGIYGSNYYVDITAYENGHITIVLKNNEIYTISHDSKTAIKTEQTDGIERINPFIFIKNNFNVSLNAKNMQTGKDVFRGKTYEYEEFNNGGRTIRMLFEGDICRAIKTMENGITNVLVIEKYDQNVDVFKFEVPQGYKLTEV